MTGVGSFQGRGPQDVMLAYGEGSSWARPGGGRGRGTPRSQLLSGSVSPGSACQEEGSVARPAWWGGGAARGSCDRISEGLVSPHGSEPLTIPVGSSSGASCSKGASGEAPRPGCLSRP